MIIYQQEYWLGENAEELLDDLWHDTHIVSFKALHLYDSKHKNMLKPWMGEFRSNPESFKIFRVTSKKHTSDFRIEGELQNRNGNPVLKTKIILHYSALIGFLGLLAFAVSVAFLLADKFEDFNPVALYIPSVAIVFFYGVSMLKDYRKTLELLEEYVSEV